MPPLLQAAPQHGPAPATAPTAAVGVASASQDLAATAPDSPPPPSASKPVLASALLSNLLRQHEGHQRYLESCRVSLESESETGTGTGYERTDRIRSGFSELDDYVLLGGMERGAVVGISGGEDFDRGGAGGGGGAGRLISLHLLTNALLSNPLAKASIIDTTGTFPVSLLAKIIRLCTVSQLGRAGRAVEKRDIEQVLGERVEELLGRIAISRAFDIEGVWEVLSEISADCQSLVSRREPLTMTEKAAEAPRYIPDQTTIAAKTTRSRSPGAEVQARRGEELEIDDSEAEDECFTLDDNFEKEDISATSYTDLVHNKTNPTATITASLPQESRSFQVKFPENKGRTEIIIIDNMTSPINELFSNRERTSSHILLSTFSRTLHTLTQTNNILTILLNTLKTPFPTHGSQGPRPPSRPSIPKKPISVFASTTSRPALGRLFSDLCALHLLITHVPKTAKDAEALYASPPDPNSEDEPRAPLQDNLQQGTRAVEYASVIEVLKDTTSNLSSWLNLPLSSAISTSYNQRRNQRPTPLPEPQPQLRTQGRIWENGPQRHKRNRTQRWAPFVVSADGLTLQSVFGPSSAGKQVSALGQMHIVKQFPFGRPV